MFILCLQNEPKRLYFALQRCLIFPQMNLYVYKKKKKLYALKNFGKSKITFGIVEPHTIPWKQLKSMSKINNFHVSIFISL